MFNFVADADNRCLTSLPLLVIDTLRSHRRMQVRLSTISERRGTQES